MYLPCTYYVLTVYLLSTYYVLTVYLLSTHHVLTVYLLSTYYVQALEAMLPKGINKIVIDLRGSSACNHM